MLIEAWLGFCWRGTSCACTQASLHPADPSTALSGALDASRTPSVPLNHHTPFSGSREGRIVGCWGVAALSPVCCWGPWFQRAASRAQLGSDRSVVEAALGTVQVTGQRAARGSTGLGKLQARLGGSMGFSPVNLESSKGNGCHSLQIIVSVSMRDGREAWRRTRDWLI